MQQKFLEEGEHHIIFKRGGGASYKKGGLPSQGVVWFAEGEENTTPRKEEALIGRGRAKYYGAPQGINIPGD